MKIAGKVALVTGGAQGTGRGFAEAILQNGGQVCITDIQVDKGLQTARDFEEQYGPGAAIFVRCDVTKKNDLQNAFDKTQEVFGRLDIMVNNAGIGDEDKWHQMIDINLTAVIMGNKMAVERMSKSNGGNGGVIFNMASSGGLTGVANLVTYCATKHGVVGLTRSLGGTMAEMPDEGIRVVCMCPSFVRTSLIEDDRMKAFIAKDPSATVMEVEEVAEAFVKMVEDDDNQGGVMLVTSQGVRYKYPRRLQSRM